MKHQFEIKMAAIFSMVICVVIGTYFIAFRSVYDRHEYEILVDESINTLQAMKQSCRSLLETANNYSKIMLADEEMQNILNTGDIYASPRNQSKLLQRIYVLLQFDRNIDSVYFWDLKNQIFTAGEDSASYLGKIAPHNTKWYQKLEGRDGRYILATEGQWGTGITESGHISLIRKYQNLEDFSQSGLLAVNVKADAIRKIYQDSLNREIEEIVFLDEENHIICSDGCNILSREKLEQMSNKLQQSKEGTYHERTRIVQTNYMISGVYMEEAGWTIIRAVPLYMKQERISILTMNIILILISTLLILLGTANVSRTMTVPIQKMLSAMKEAEEGVFVKIEEKAFFYEFRFLFEGYNRLLDKVDQLLRQTIEKQKVIRRIELNEMNEQMKPHFLYNTLDSIEALAMMDEQEKLCDIVEALGDFYRKSVSKGREMITIQDEMTIVTDYIRIMSIRFEQLFEAHMEVEDACRSFLIPKLTLQPIVENSIHHGLRERAETGNLWIQIQREAEWMHIRIADDGIGFSKEQLEEIEKGEEPYQKKSYGLRGTIERLRLVYGKNFRYRISSDRFILTDISFYIHLGILEGEQYEENEGNIG